MRYEIESCTLCALASSSASEAIFHNLLLALSGAKGIFGFFPTWGGRVFPIPKTVVKKKIGKNRLKLKLKVGGEGGEFNVWEKFPNRFFF